MHTRYSKGEYKKGEYVQRSRNRRKLWLKENPKRSGSREKRGVKNKGGKGRAGGLLSQKGRRLAYKRFVKDDRGEKG